MTAAIACILYRALFQVQGNMSALTVVDVIVYISVANTVISGIIYLADYRRLLGVDES